MSLREGIDERHHVTTHQRSRREGGRPRSDRPRARGTKLRTGRAPSVRIGPGTQQFRCPRPWGSPRMSRWLGSCSWVALLQSHHGVVANTPCSPPPPSPPNSISTSYECPPSWLNYNDVGAILNTRVQLNPPTIHKLVLATPLELLMSSCHYFWASAQVFLGSTDDSWQEMHGDWSYSSCCS